MAKTGLRTATTAADVMGAVLALTADLDLPSLLQRLVGACTGLTGARYGALNILDEHGASRTLVQSGFADPVVAALGGAPHAVGVLGQIPTHGVLRLDDLTQHPAFLGLPAAHPAMGSFLGAAVRVRETVFGYLYLAEKEGGFDDFDESVVTALGAAAGVAIENAQLYDVAARREHWLQAGQQITTLLLEGAGAEDVLLQIAGTAREIAGADTCALVLPGMRGELVMEFVVGRAHDRLLGLTMDRGGRSWQAFSTGVGAVVASLATASTPQLGPMRQFGPALYAPLRTAGHAIGVLVLLRPVGAPPFSPSDLTLSESFAAQAALAFVLAQARRAQDVAALFEERQRIARDLHDLAIQQLFATGMQLETVGLRVAAGTDPELADIVAEAVGNVDSSVRQIRVIVRALHDPGAISSLVERLRHECVLARTGLGFAPELVLTLAGRVLDRAGADQGDLDRLDDIVGADLANDVVAVAREGLANAARHAHSATVTVRVTVTGSGPDGTIEVQVEDDGVGLDRRRPRSSGTANLAARARQDGGAVTFSAPSSGRGTLLRWWAPLG